MADTYIVDLRHCLADSGESSEMPGPPINRATYFASIVCVSDEREVDRGLVGERVVLALPWTEALPRRDRRAR